MIDGGRAVVGHLQTVMFVVLHSASGVGRELERDVTGVGAVGAFRERQRWFRLTLQHYWFGYIAWGTT